VIALDTIAEVTKNDRYDACVVGGAGHVGAPLAIVMATHGIRTLIHDIDRKALDTISGGRLPFLDEGGEPVLRAALDAGMLGFTSDYAATSGIPVIIVTIGTPIDEFHNPVLRAVTDCIDQLISHLSDDQTLILRSTVFPGVTELVQEHLRTRGKQAQVAFCPERVVQGQATRELQSLPQIVSGMTPEAEEVAAGIFSRFAPKIVRMTPKEAEFAKLFSNAYRYIQFAAANQFFVMVESEGLDYRRVLTGLKADYPRLRDLPGPGFAAGPCLYKDTLQLASFANHQFALGQAAININEGLPDFIIGQLRKRFALQNLTVGILGMAFKADSDDTRSSLSYKLRRLLRVRARTVLTTDPFVRTDPTLLPVDEVIDRSDLLIVGVPHSSYRTLNMRNKPVVDLWGLYGGSIIPEPHPVDIAPDVIATSGAARRTS
jgi:UDP-N-acetyl-D-mannosaminuronic acid dehydrogenase